MENPNKIEEITPHLKNHGGGPRTDEGRARSSQNARKHLAFANVALLPGEHQQDLQAILDGYAEELKPRTPVEDSLVRELAQIEWRKGRVLNGETKAILKAEEDGKPVEKVLETYGRYSANLVRQYEKTLKILKEHQAPRLERMGQEWRQAVLIREHYKRQGIDWDPAVDEFVFSKEQLDQQIAFNKQWARFVKNVIIFPTTKYQDERYLQKAL